MDTAELSDMLELERLKSRYFRCIDTKDWDRLRELCTDDMVFYMEQSVLPATDQPISVGGDAFVRNVSRILRTAVTVHHGHMPDIELTGPRTAHGVWSMFDWVDDAERNTAIKGYGHYHEDYEKGDDGQWRIKVMRLTRIRVDQIPPTCPEGARPWPDPWSGGQPVAPTG